VAASFVLHGSGTCDHFVPRGDSSLRSRRSIDRLGAFGLNLLSVRLATLVRTDMPPASVIFLLGCVGGLLDWVATETDRGQTDQGTRAFSMIAQT